MTDLLKVAVPVCPSDPAAASWAAAFVYSVHGRIADDMDGVHIESARKPRGARGDGVAQDARRP